MMWWESISPFQRKSHLRKMFMQRTLVCLLGYRLCFIGNQVILTVSCFFQRGSRPVPIHWRTQVDSFFHNGIFWYNEISRIYWLLKNWIPQKWAMIIPKIGSVIPELIITQKGCLATTVHHFFGRLNHQIPVVPGTRRGGSFEKWTWLYKEIAYGCLWELFVSWKAMRWSLQKRKHAMTWHELNGTNGMNEQFSESMNQRMTESVNHCIN